MKSNVRVCLPAQEEAIVKRACSDQTLSGNASPDLWMYEKSTWCVLARTRLHLTHNTPDPNRNRAFSSCLFLQLICEPAHQHRRADPAVGPCSSVCTCEKKVVFCWVTHAEIQIHLLSRGAALRGTSSEWQVVCYGTTGARRYAALLDLSSFGANHTLALKRYPRVLWKICCVLFPKKGAGNQQRLLTAVQREDVDGGRTLIEGSLRAVAPSPSSRSIRVFPTRSGIRGWLELVPASG